MNAQTQFAGNYIPNELSLEYIAWLESRLFRCEMLIKAVAGMRVATVEKAHNPPSLPYEIILRARDYVKKNH